MVRVKVCGITNLEDATIAVEAGADALGFIFVEGTPRFVTPAQAAPIIRGLPPFVTPVGVFWDHPRGHVKAVAETCGLRALQFHGDEPPEDLAGHDLPVIKTIKLPPVSAPGGAPVDDLRNLAQVVRFRGVAAAVLLDTAVRWSEGELRASIDWRLAATGPAGGAGEMDSAARAWAGSVRLILSGGLTPDNVARAVEIVRPYAVDVNSGVEARPGKKDPDKVRRFVAEARRAG
jgi:phosphoribosylanthranilate isomerase